MKTIGILGGMGPLATSDLYRKIITNTRADSDQDHLHVIIDSNTSIPDRTRHLVGNGPDPAPEMIRSARILEQAGADFVAMPCSTAHWYLDRLQSAVRIPFLNMIAETVTHIRRQHGPSAVVGLLATDGTIQSGVYDPWFEKARVRVVKPQATQRNVMTFIYECMKKSDFSAGPGNLLLAVEELRDLGADLFVLGCTELSSAKDLFRIQGAFVDPMDVLARTAIVRAGGRLNP